MLRLAFNENFNNDVLWDLQRRLPNLDTGRSQDADQSGAEDPEVLCWAASQDRVVVTHDAATLIEFAYERVRRGERIGEQRSVLDVGRF